MITRRAAVEVRKGFCHPHFGVQLLFPMKLMVPQKCAEGRGDRPPKKYKAAMVAPEVCDSMGRVGLQLQARHWSTATPFDEFGVLLF